MDILKLLLTVLSRSGEKEKEPWEKGNSWLVGVGILPEFKVTAIRTILTNNSENIVTNLADIKFTPIQVYYKNMYENENITTGLVDINFVVTKV